MKLLAQYLAKALVSAGALRPAADQQTLLHVRLLRIIEPVGRVGIHDQVLLNIDGEQVDPDLIYKSQSDAESISLNDLNGNVPMSLPRSEPGRGQR